MPEPGQPTLSRELTNLIEDVLWQSEGRRPRLSDVTDAGHHPAEYYPPSITTASSERCDVAGVRSSGGSGYGPIVDFYHGSEYVSKLAAVLFGETREAHGWAHKLCKWLKHKPNAVFRVLHSEAVSRTSAIRYNKDGNESDC